MATKTVAGEVSGETTTVDVATNAGNADDDTQRVVVASDQTAIPVDDGHPDPQTDALTDAELRAAAVPVEGDTAHDAADAGNPVKIGGRASNTPPASVADGDRVDAWLNNDGGQWVWLADARDQPIAVTAYDAAYNPIVDEVPIAGQTSAMGVAILDGSGNQVVPQTDGLTDAELRASAVPVSAATLPLPSGASTSALQGGGLPAALGAGGGLKVDGSGTALPVSGTVTANAGSGTFGTGLDTPIGATNESAAATDTSTSGLNGLLKRIAQRLTTLLAVFPTTIDTNSGSKSASTLRVVLATDQPALTNKLLVTPDSVALPANQSVNQAQVAGTTTDTNSGNKSAGTQRVVLATDQPTMTNAQPVNASPRTSGGLTIYRNIDIDETGINVKNGAGQVYGWYMYNAAAATRYVKFYNKATAPTVGTDTPVLTLPIPAGGAANVEFTNGIAFATGIGVGATTGVADNSTGAPATNDVQINVLYA